MGSGMLCSFLPVPFTSFPLFHPFPITEKMEIIKSFYRGSTGTVFSKRVPLAAGGKKSGALYSNIMMLVENHSKSYYLCAEIPKKEVNNNEYWSQ